VIKCLITWKAKDQRSQEARTLLTNIRHSCKKLASEKHSSFSLFPAIFLWCQAVARFESSISGFIGQVLYHCNNSYFFYLKVLIIAEEVLWHGPQEKKTGERKVIV
jgi:hypothetical protein